FGDGDVAVLNDGLGDAVDKVIPERDVAEMVLQRDEVLGGGGAVHAGHGAERRARHVHGHADAVLLGQVADLFRFEDAAAGGQVGVNDVDGARLQQRHEAFLQVNVFARADGRFKNAFQLHPLLGVL